MHDDPLIGLPDFRERLAKAGSVFFGLDYDGTLAPFTEERMEAAPLEGIPDILSGLNRLQRAKVAIISGRPVDEIFKLIGDLGLLVSGSHGYELYLPGAGTDITTPTPLQTVGLDRGFAAAAEFDFEHNIERKVASIAAHTRAVSDDQRALIETKLLEKWRSFAFTYELEVSHFNGGIELRSTGWNKGDILLRIMKMHVSDLVVYIGDDTTDEDAFEVIEHSGIGIKVGDRSPDSKAKASINDVEGVKVFLQKCLAILSGKVD